MWETSHAASSASLLSVVQELQTTPDMDTVGRGCGFWRTQSQATQKFPLAPYSERALPNTPGMCDSLLDFEVWLLLNLRDWDVMEPTFPCVKSGP